MPGTEMDVRAAWSSSWLTLTSTPRGMVISVLVGEVVCTAAVVRRTCGKYAKPDVLGTLLNDMPDFVKCRE